MESPRGSRLKAGIPQGKHLTGQGRKIRPITQPLSGQISSDSRIEVDCPLSNPDQYSVSPVSSARPVGGDHRTGVRDKRMPMINYFCHYMSSHLGNCALSKKLNTRINFYPNWLSYPIKLPIKLLDGATCNQLEFIQFLLDRGIVTRCGIMNAYQELPHRDANWSLHR